MTSCVSYTTIKREKFSYVEQNKQKVFVVNSDEFKNEYKIFTKLNKFNISQIDAPGLMKIKLKPLRAVFEGPRCYTGAFSLSVVSLGFFPLKHMETSILEYERSAENNVSNHIIELKIKSAISWFHLLSPFKSRKHAIRRAAKYAREIKPNKIN